MPSPKIVLIQQIFSAVASVEHVTSLLQQRAQERDTFHEIYDSEPSYVIWSISRLSANAGPSQRAWLEYIEERVTADEKATEEDEKAMEANDCSAKQSVAMTHLESRLSSLEQTVQEMAQRAVNMESLLQQVFQASSTSSVAAAALLSSDRLSEGKPSTLP